MREEGTTPDGAYQIGFGWRRSDWFLIPLAVLCAMCALGAGWLGLAEVSDARSGGLRDLLEGARGAVVAVLASFLALIPLVIPVLRLSGQISGRVALRVDSAGVTLGMAPPWPRRYVVVVPWSEIIAVFLWQAGGYRGRRRMQYQYIGIKRRKGARPLPGSSRGLALSMLQRSVPPGVPAQVVAESRMVERGRVDRAQLAEAVARFAPEVEFVDRW